MTISRIFNSTDQPTVQSFNSFGDNDKINKTNINGRLCQSGIENCLL